MTDSASSGRTLRVEPDLVYRWTEPWNDWLQSRSSSERLEWIHSGVAVTGAGDLVVISHDLAEAHVLGRDGSQVRTFSTGVTQGHGVHITSEAGRDVLWVADNGTRRRRDRDGSYTQVRGSTPPRVVKMTLTGEHLLSIPAPDIEMYRSGRYSPTGVAVDEAIHGGSGDVWVADGYGESYVHRFRQDGSYLMSLSGAEGAGRFACPHAVWIDRRGGDPELYVSDRKNNRLQVFSLDGEFRRSIGDGSIFRLPGGFAAVEKYLMVAELEARIAVLDAHDQIRGYLGGDAGAAARSGFPNELGPGDHPVRPASLRAGYFNSPHGLAADRAGNLYISEFLIGGRLVKLQRQT